MVSSANSNGIGSPRHHQILVRPATNLSRGDPANQQEDAQHDENDSRSKQWILV